MQVVLDLGAVAAAVGAAGGTAVALWRYLIRPIKRWIEQLHTVVMRELQPNSGNSMRDRLCHLEEMVEHHVRDHAIHRKETEHDEA